MNRAQSYIFRQAAISTLFIVVTLTAVIWLTQALRFIRFILNKGLSIDVFFYITSLLLPSFVLITLPVSMFFAALFTLNKMTNDRELVVLRSCGMSHWQAAAPMFLLSFLGVVVCYSISLYFLPLSVQEFRRVQTAARSRPGPRDRASFFTTAIARSWTARRGTFGSSISSNTASR